MSRLFTTIPSLMGPLPQHSVFGTLGRIRTHKAKIRSLCSIHWRECNWCSHQDSNLRLITTNDLFYHLNYKSKLAENSVLETQPLSRSLCLANKPEPCPVYSPYLAAGVGFEPTRPFQDILFSRQLPLPRFFRINLP